MSESFIWNDGNDHQLASLSPLTLHHSAISGDTVKWTLDQKREIIKITFHTFFFLSFLFFFLFFSFFIDELFFLAPNIFVGLLKSSRNEPWSAGALGSITSCLTGLAGNSVKAGRRNNSATTSTWSQSGSCHIDPNFPERFNWDYFLR